MSQSKHRRHGQTRPRLNLKTGRAPRVYYEKDTEEPVYEWNPVFLRALFTRLQNKHGGNQWNDWTVDQIGEETNQIIRDCHGRVPTRHSAGFS